VLDVVQLAHRHGVRVKLAPSTTELLVHEGEYVPGQGIPLFELRPPMLSGLEWATKRVFDVVLAVAFLVVGLPLWLLLAAAIKLDSAARCSWTGASVSATRSSGCSSSGR
jgi:lipopolysaccharide/colanic/teichoic acid biosynthesis glycosyltransferase